MKRNKFEKKLVLSKKTITNLGNNEMRKLEGGISAIICTAPYRTCYTFCCPVEP